MRHNITGLGLCIRPFGKKRAAVTCIMAVFLALALCPGAAVTRNHKAPQKHAPTAAEKKEKSAKEKIVKEAATAERGADSGVDEKGQAPGKAAAGDAGKEKKEADATGLPTRDYQESDFRPQVEEESTVWLVFKTIFILGIIVGGFYFFFKFVTKKAGIQVLGQNVIKVLSMIPLGPNKFIQVVDLAGKVLVLGITEGSINVLLEIREKDEIDRIRLLSAKGGGQKTPGFQEYLAGQLGRVFGKVSELRDRGGKQARSEDAGEVDMEYLMEQKRRLRNLNGTDNE